MSDPYSAYLLQEGTVVVVNHDDQHLVFIQEPEVTEEEEEDDDHDVNVVIFTPENIAQLKQILSMHLDADGKINKRENVNVLH